MFEEWDHARSLLHKVVIIYVQLQLFNAGFSLCQVGDSLITGPLEGRPDFLISIRIITLDKLDVPKIWMAHDIDKFFTLSRQDLAL